MAQRLGHHVHANLAAWLTGVTMPAAPTVLKLALSGVDPGDDGSALSEPVNTGYLRQVITVVATPYAGGGTLLTLVNPVVFGPNTGNDPWPTMTYGAVLDGDNNFIVGGPLGVQRTCPKDDTVSFGAGTVQFLLK